jgi:cytochrome P450
MTSALTGPDLASAAHKRDPFSFYARLCAIASAVRVAVPRFGDAWFLTGAEDVVACLMDDERFAREQQSIIVDAVDAHSALLAPPNSTLGPNMLNLDGAAHRRLRVPLSKWFTRKAIERWRAPAESMAETLLDRMAQRSEADLVADYALPFALAVIHILLGVPPDSGRVFNEDWARELFHARKARPVDDLATALACGGDGEPPLDEREFVAMVKLLLYAGHETTANLIASGVLVLLENAVAVEKLLDEPALLQRAIEELLRFCAPVEMATARLVAEDTVVGGECLRRGDVVFPVVAAANRDATRFAAPDRLDLEREPNPHVAFGAGPHHCLGLHLARMEAEIAFRALFRRFPRLSLIAPATSLKWRSTHVVRGLEALPVQLR